MAREGVAEVMEVKILDAGPFNRPPERATYGVCVLDWKQAPVEAAELPQSLDGRVVQVDFASIAVFGLAERGNLVVQSIDLRDDREALLRAFRC